MQPDKLLTTIGNRMKEYLNKFFRITFVLFLATALQSCGGSSNDKSDKYSISANTSSISFSNEFLQVSDDTFKVDISFQGEGLLVGFAPDSQPAAWLNYRTENVTANSATLYVNVISAENIIADLYQTKLRLSTGNVDKVELVHHDIDVSLLVWQLITDKNLVSFRGTLGDTSIASQTLAITSESNEWSVASDVDWLTFDIDSGTGDAVLTLTPDISTFTDAQLYQGNITLTETTTGDSKVIPVEIGLDKHYLFSNQSTMSFTQLANISATSKKLMINTNSPLPISWQATTGVDWLSLTRTSNSNELIVNVKPEANFTEAQNSAVITINAVDSENNINEQVVAETIQISFYQSADSSDNIVISDLVVNNNAIVNSTYLPHVYIGENNQLKVYHQYTGELLSTLDVSPEESLLAGFLLHPDGQMLIAKADETITNEDETTTVITHRYQINLVDNSVTEIAEPTIEYEPQQYVSFAGRHFIVTQTLEFADDNLQRLFWDTTAPYFTSRTDQASVTQAFYALDLSDSSFKRYSAAINDFTNEKIIVEQTHQYRPELLEENQTVSNFIVDDNETGIYAISPTSEWISFDGDIFTDNGLLAQAENNVTLTLTKSLNSRAHFSRFDPVNGFIIDVYDNAQSLVNTIRTQGQQPSDINLSADDKRLVIHASNAQQVELINVEQFNVSSNQVTFSTTFGNSTIEEQQITLTGMSDSWQASSNNDWLIIETSTVDGVATITIAIDEKNITTWGLLNGSITITDPVSGSSTVVQIEVAVDEVRLFSNNPALAFNQQLNKATLTHTVNILTNKQSMVAWQASSNVDWLDLSADNVNNNLTVTVDPSKVSENGIHAATITLAPQNASDALTGTIAVTFSKGDFDNTEFSELVIDSVIPNSAGVVLDPMRPYIYVAQGDAIDIYNMIDGSKHTSVASPLPDFDLTNLVIHPDGSMLLASNLETYLDENEQEATRTNYYQLNLVDLTFTQLNSDDVDIVYSPEKIVMISGKALVVTQALEFANLGLTQQYWDNSNAFITSVIADVKDNNTVIAFNSATSNLLHNTFEYNAFTDKSLTLASTLDYINPAFANNVSNLVTSADGSNIYTTNTATEWSTFDGSEFADQGLLDGNPFTSPVAVITDNADNSYFYRFDFTIGFFTLTKYDENQARVWVTGYTAGAVDVYISADYERVIHYNSDAEQLVIDYMPD